MNREGRDVRVMYRNTIRDGVASGYTRPEVTYQYIVKATKQGFALGFLVGVAFMTVGLIIFL